MSRFPLTVASTILIVSAAHVSFTSSNKSDAALALLQQVHDKTKLASHRTYSQQGTATITTGPKPVEGTYYYASSSSLTREALLVPEYQEIRIRSGNSEKISRPVDFDPLGPYLLFHATRPLPWLQLLPGEHVSKLHSAKGTASPEDCVEIESKRPARSVCVYKDGTLASLRPSDGFMYEYSDYSSFGDLQLPGKIRVFDNKTVVVELAMTPASPSDTVSDDVLKPRLTLGWCENLVPSIEISDVPPQYPQAARRAGVQGSVDVYALVGIDGHPKDAVAVQSPAQELGQATVKSVSQWTYQPAMCGTTPVLSELNVKVNYTLRPF